VLVKLLTLTILIRCVDDLVHVLIKSSPSFSLHSSCDIFRDQPKCQTAKKVQTEVVQPSKTFKLGVKLEQV